MRFRSILPFVAIALVLMDIYVYQALKAAMMHASPRLRQAATVAYWLVALAGWAFIAYPLITGRMAGRQYGHLSMVLLTLFVGLLLGKLLASLVVGIDDLRRGITWVARQSGRGAGAAAPSAGAAISRSQFLSWLGLLAGGSIVATLVYGFSNKYDYRVRRLKLRFPNLPPAFRGLRILQLSDIHSGSFDNADKVARGIDMALAERPDIIFFTGDLVNNHTDEVLPYVELLSRLQAPMGVYSILGNHDYGDYASWPSPEAKAENLQRLKDIQASMGWTMLNNTNTVLERGGQRIALIGVENWSAKLHFPKYGDLAEAYRGVEELPFKILLSHDPSHWDAEVRPRYGDIDLMLAGHTHGMQFGVEIPGFRWSPAQYAYKEWAGLYREGAQRLYVNRGYGFIGYPGRVGILPEITVIELA